MNLPVWLYWEGEKPYWIEMCQESVLNHVPNVNLLTPETFSSLRITDTDIDLSTLCVAHRADYIRAYLLAKFGGFWIDADCLVMRSLAPLFGRLEKYRFVGYRERSGFVTNNFMGSPQNSYIAENYYQKICAILRSGIGLEWLTLGSLALTATLDASGNDWYELETHMIQPVCWSEPQRFFEKKSHKCHEEQLDKKAYCYMLSANMINGFMEKNPSENLLDEKSFFKFLYNESKQNYILSNISFRKNTDDDHWVIPEVIGKDMYHIQEALSGLSPSTPEYIIDCGAHIGAFSVMCAAYMPNMQIISFEPNPDSFAYLKENAKIFGKIKPYNQAVDVQQGVLKLFRPACDDWTGRWTMIKNGNNFITVESIDLFKFINELDKPVFMLKMDLEGYEEFILGNSHGDDLRRVKILIIETHTDTFDHQKLIDFGYKLLFKPEISADRQFVYCR